MPQAARRGGGAVAHGPEKWIPVFGKGHAQINAAIRSFAVALFAAMLAAPAHDHAPAPSIVSSSGAATVDASDLFDPLGIRQTLVITFACVRQNRDAGARLDALGP